MFRHVPDQGPTSNVNVDILGVLAITKKGLSMLPAIQSTDVPERRRNNGFQRFRLALTPVSTFHVSRLDLAAVVHDSSRWINERLDFSVSPLPEG